jgi:hypothetical protein
MPMTPEAAKKYKPRRPDVTIDDVITPETRAKMQEAKENAADQAAGSAAGAAYEKARTTMKKGGKVKMSAGGYTRAADGIAQRGKTRGKMC